MGGWHSRLYSGTAGYMVVAHKILVSAPVPLELIGPLNWVGAGPRGFGDEGVWDLGLTTVYLVEDYPDLVLLLPDGLDGLLELITDVELVGVKQQDDPVSTLSKPGQHSSKIIAPVTCHLGQTCGGYSA